MLYELFLFGLLSGVTTWLFGFGGGFVAVPLLYAVIIQSGAVKVVSAYMPCKSPLLRPLLSCCVRQVLQPFDTIGLDT